MATLEIPGPPITGAVNPAQVVFYVKYSAVVPHREAPIRRPLPQAVLPVRAARQVPAVAAAMLPPGNSNQNPE